MAAPFKYLAIGWPMNGIVDKDHNYVNDDVLLVMEPCRLVRRYERFGEHTVSIFRAEDGNPTEIRTRYLPDASVEL
jgi:hypothetical protein